MTTFGKILDGITVLIIVAIIALLAPMLFCINPYIVLSGSMEPVVKTGSLTYIDTTIDKNDIKVGDIIAFKMDDITATHRVTKVYEDRLVTKGDANAVEDIRPVMKKDVIGTLAYTIPYVGYIVKNLRSPAAMSILIFLSMSHIAVAVLSNTDKKEKENIVKKKS